jgi:acetolactate synthase-1/2/3 large subunit
MPEDGPLDGGALVGRILKEQQVRYLFAINGGHIFPILANLRNNGVKLIHMRHEQACAYAADAYARTSGQPGVCSVTAGCGLTNAVTGLCVAALTGSAVVCIAGQHPTTEDHIGSFQEAYGVDICGSFAKSVKRVVDWSTIEIDVRQAFREASSYPQGPAVVEIPANILYHGDDPARQRRGARFYAAEELRSQGEPARIERVLELLQAADRPLLVAGDGVFWSDAAAELREFAELAHVPVYTRRAGQGAVAEDHPLAVRGVWKKPFTGRADVVVAVGFRFWSGEHFGEPPTWSENATYIQIDAAPNRIGWHVPAQLAIVGDPKLVLRQLTEAARRLKVDFSDRAESGWLREVAEARGNFERMIDEEERGARDHMPLHAGPLARPLCEVIDRDATVVVDSFTLSGWVTQWLAARFPGQIVDAGPLAPVGHGVGMAIGAQLARPGKQVVLVIGDGGLGIGGWDIETALRYDLPIIVILWNNSSWGPSFEQMPLLKGRTDPFNMLDNIRYDRMFAALGCHTEHVERWQELRPALERACQAGKAALVNVIGDKRIGHPRLGGNLLGSTQV